MQAALEQTAAYVSTRQQFGKPLASLQVVQHRIAEMAVCCTEAEAASELTARRLALDANTSLALASMARSKCARAARYVAQEAVQLHGAMGVCEELPIAATFRALTMFRQRDGDATTHAHTYGRQLLANGNFQRSQTLLDLNPEDAAFRDEVRAFLAAHLTDELRTGQAGTTAIYPEPQVSQPWQHILHRQGWLVPLWPKEAGGTGWTALQRFIFETECALAGAPLVHPMGVRLVGPVILRFGTTEQKDFYLPRILRGEDYWCQGFSEPGAGSDLASLKLQARPDGDHYLLNGSKIWTTHAHHANRMFALVRTSSEGKPQQGISFLLVDMRLPGITVRPINTIGGDHDVNEVFFDNVRVPQSERIGAENAGWDCAKYLLEFERGAGIFSPRLRSQLKRVSGPVQACAREHITSRFGEVAADLDAFEWLELKTMGGLAPGANPGPVSSILKLEASRIRQAIAELGVEALGSDAQRWRSDAGVGSSAPATLVPEFFNSRAFTIFGGAAEIQLGLIARTVLQS